MEEEKYLLLASEITPELLAGAFQNRKTKPIYSEKFA
jgi:hypothetical protein